MTGESPMSIDEIGRMTLPQLACRASNKPPGSDEKQFRSLAAYESAIREAEEAWSRDS